MNRAAPGQQDAMQVARQRLEDLMAKARARREGSGHKAQIGLRTAHQKLSAFNAARTAEHKIPDSPLLRPPPEVRTVPITDDLRKRLNLPMPSAGQDEPDSLILAQKKLEALAAESEQIDRAEVEYDSLAMAHSVITRLASGDTAETTQEEANSLVVATQMLAEMAARESSARIEPEPVDSLVVAQRLLEEMAADDNEFGVQEDERDSLVIATQLLQDLARTSPSVQSSFGPIDGPPTEDSHVVPAADVPNEHDSLVLATEMLAQLAREKKATNAHQLPVGIPIYHPPPEMVSPQVFRPTEAPPADLATWLSHEQEATVRASPHTVQAIQNRVNELSPAGVLDEAPPRAQVVVGSFDAASTSPPARSNPELVPNLEHGAPTMFDQEVQFPQHKEDNTKLYAAIAIILAIAVIGVVLLLI